MKFTFAGFNHAGGGGGGGASNKIFSLSKLSVFRRVEGGAAGKRPPKRWRERDADDDGGGGRLRVIKILALF